MTPIEFFYYLGYSIKKHYSMRKQKKLPHKVFSIGNITFGGTGKTPATIALAKEAQKRGFNPYILTRGYRGIAKGPCFVNKGEGPLLSEYQAGDEPLLMSEKLRQIPIVKSKNRYQAGMFAIQNLPSSISDPLSEILFILDDGFQHWGLFRDQDILLIDSANPFGNRKLLPLGILREPLAELARASTIVVTKTDYTDVHQAGIEDAEYSKLNELVREIKQYNEKAPIFSAGHIPSTFITRDRHTLPLSWADGKRFYGFCGIGTPRSFMRTLRSLNIDLVGFKSYRDHYRYTINDLRTIEKDAVSSGAQWIVTTEKDIMRFKGLNVPESFVSLDIEFRIDEQFYEVLFNV